MYKHFKTESGFTLIELIVVIGIFATLTSIATINLLKPQDQVSVAMAADILASDLKLQQINAMSGSSLGTTTAQPQGIRFETNRYTLFSGSTYASSYDSYAVDISSNLSLVYNLPPNQELVFAKRSGEVTNFIEGQNSITVRHISTGEQKVITISRRGVIDVN